MELRSPSVCHHVAEQGGFGSTVLFQQWLGALPLELCTSGEPQNMKGRHSMILEAASQSAHESLRSM